MSVVYRLVQRKDLSKNAQPDTKLFYANAKSAGVCDIYELCETISSVSTASRGDVRCVLDGMVDVLCLQLSKGMLVKVGDFGTFQMQFGSKGTITEKEFSATLIKNKRIVFRPGIFLQKAMNNMSFEKLSDDKKKEEAKPNPDDKPDSI